VLEELALDAELNILQAYDRAVGRGKQHKPNEDMTPAAGGKCHCLHRYINNGWSTSYWSAVRRWS